MCVLCVCVCGVCDVCGVCVCVVCVCVCASLRVCSCPSVTLCACNRQAGRTGQKEKLIFTGIQLLMSLLMSLLILLSVRERTQTEGGVTGRGKSFVIGAVRQSHESSMSP